MLGTILSLYSLFESRVIVKESQSCVHRCSRNISLHQLGRFFYIYFHYICFHMILHCILYCTILYFTLGFPGVTSDKEPTCQCRRHKRCKFDPWVGKIPWRRVWQPTPVFLFAESHAQRSLLGYSPQGLKESDTTEAT